MPDCIPLYMQTQYFHRKGRDPFVASGTSGNPYPTKQKICPLNSLNTSQKNTPKSASVFFSSLFFLPLFPCFFYPSTLVPASLHPASHCFPLLSPSLSLPFPFVSSFFLFIFSSLFFVSSFFLIFFIFFLSLKIKIFICL